MKTQFKSWAGVLSATLLTMSYSIVNADTSGNSSTNPDRSITQPFEAKHKHPYGPIEKGPRRYMEHKTEREQQSKPEAKTNTIRRGPPGKTFYRERRASE
ncbi:hypothetical protein [uncultured Methylophaga sp.]|jgi:hypothetical protein|uniref:hypothetical protein n=1 Tax=uncultured Methylophaga sp. TaxID=285271 RepID=UPI0030D8508F|tara:strand:- start:1271 stop:1570 length:300 start_codon:yes stop_codon:yes gene_type:complete